VADERRLDALQPHLAFVLAEARLRQERVVVGIQRRLEREAERRDAARRRDDVQRLAPQILPRCGAELAVVVAGIPHRSAVRRLVDAHDPPRSLRIRVGAEIQERRVRRPAVWHALDVGYGVRVHGSR
jgi:hypothetical protein